MNHKQRIKMLADYVLSEGHERENVKDEIDNYYTGDIITRKELRTIAEDSIWYHAMLLLYGRNEARKELTQLLREVK